MATVFAPPVYKGPGLTITKEKTQATATLSSTQRFPIFVGIGRNTIDINKEEVIRGHDDNPSDPFLSPTNGKDSLSRPATEIFAVESAPGLNDYIRNLDYILTDGKVDWGPGVDTTVNRENSTPTDGTFQVNVLRPKVKSVNRVRNFSVFQSAEQLIVGVNASFDSGSNVMTINLAHTFISNAAGRGIATVSDFSFVFRNDSQGKFQNANLIPFATTFTTAKQWKFDPATGTILSYDPTDATLSSLLELDYFYMVEYSLTDIAIDSAGSSFVLSVAANPGVPTMLATDFLEVDYISSKDGREPAPGQHYFVSYKALKTDTELNPKFYGSQDQATFQSELGFPEEYLTGNQLALAGGLQYTLGTNGFFVAPVKTDSDIEWGNALQRISELAFDDLVILTDDKEVKELARSLTLDRSSPDAKRRTILWLSTSPGQVSGFPLVLENSILSELEVLRNERLVYTGSVRKDQLLLIDIPKTDGTTVTNVSVPMYWANVAIVNTMESFASPSTSLLRIVLELFRLDTQAEKYTLREQDVLAGSGTMLIEDVLGTPRVRDDVTTVSAFGTADEAEISVRTAEDALVQKIIEPTLDRVLVGTTITDRNLVLQQGQQLLTDILTQAQQASIILSGTVIFFRFSAKDPRVIEFRFEWEPIFTVKRLSGVYAIRLPR